MSVLFMMEVIMNQRVFKWVASSTLLTAWAIIADGELSALTWLPIMVVLLLNHCARPNHLPPEEYVSKRNRTDTTGWIKRLFPMKQLWNPQITEGNDISVYNLCTGRACRKSSGFQYQSYHPQQRCAAIRARNRKSAISLHLVLLTCLSAATVGRAAAFDSDSKQIAINNCSSRCLTNSRNDFLPGTVTPCNIGILGVGGRVKCKLKGTVSWTIEDDQGRSHDIVIPDTPMCTALPHRLLSPQHWAQETE
jgi:hypothetical protein